MHEVYVGGVRREARWMVAGLRSLTEQDRGLLYSRFDIEGADSEARLLNLAHLTRFCNYYMDRDGDLDFMLTETQRMVAWTLARKERQAIALQQEREWRRRFYRSGKTWHFRCVPRMDCIACENRTAGPSSACDMCKELTHLAFVAAMNERAAASPLDYLLEAYDWHKDSNPLTEVSS